MQQKTLSQLEKRIAKIKRDLPTIGEMRPGSLTQQYQKPKEKKGAFYQISYTHKMRSKTEYVRPEFVKDLKRQIKNYKKFKEMTKEWTDLAILHSKLKIKLAIK